jgi:hypothetical protein
MMMYLCNTLFLSMLIASSNGFAPSKISSVKTTPFFVTLVEPEKATAPTTTKTELSAAIAPPKPQSSTNKKKLDGSAHGKEGIFSPLVQLSKSILGEKELNKVRAKAIGLHSDVIGKFVDSADSRLGDAVLKALYSLADKNHNGTVEEEELTEALQVLGFDLKPKQIAGIFQRADTDESGALDFEEWRREAPKTLRTNLIKLAKKNGGELGFLV